MAFLCKSKIDSMNNIKKLKPYWVENHTSNNQDSCPDKTSNSQKKVSPTILSQMMWTPEGETV